MRIFNIHGTIQTQAFIVKQSEVKNFYYNDYNDCLSNEYLSKLDEAFIKLHVKKYLMSSDNFEEIADISLKRFLKDEYQDYGIVSYCSSTEKPFSRYSRGDYIYINGYFEYIKNIQHIPKLSEFKYLGKLVNTFLIV